MSTPLRTNVNPPIDDFLATVLRRTEKHNMFDLEENDVPQPNIIFPKQISNTQTKYHMCSYPNQISYSKDRDRKN